VHFKFSVEDTGIGIAKEQTRTGVRALTQLDGSLTRVQGGTGIGLCSRQGLGRAHGGTIGVNSSSGRIGILVRRATARSSVYRHACNPVSPVPRRRIVASAPLARGKCGSSVPVTSAGGGAPRNTAGHPKAANPSQ